MSSYEYNKKKLMEIIKEKGIVIQPVSLSSDIKSEYYYDFKTVLYDPEGLSLAGDMLLEVISREFTATKSVGGIEIGSIPLTTTIILKSTEYGRYGGGLTGFTVRKNVKGYGLSKKIEGIIRESIVVVDDVLTTGNSVWNTIDAIMEEGHSVVGVVFVMDREEGPTNVLKDRKVKYFSLFKHSDFKEYIEDKLRKKNRQIN